MAELADQCIFSSGWATANKTGEAYTEKLIGHKCYSDPDLLLGICSGNNWVSVFILKGFAIGLDGSHNAFDGAYSAFGKLMQAVAFAADRSYPEHYKRNADGSSVGRQLLLLT